MKARKDPKGRALHKGESYNKKTKLYIYKYKDPFGKIRYEYSKDLGKLREKEERLKKDQLDGLDIYLMGKATVNFAFDRYIKFRTDLRQSTRSNYLYTYNHYVRNGFGERKIADIKYSDVLQFYWTIVEEKELSISTLESIHTLLHPAFEQAVRDDIIRHNPTEGVIKTISRKYDKVIGVKRALTPKQQEAFIKALDMPKTIRFRPVFTAMLGTGMRIGELAGLRDVDIDTDNLFCDVNHEILYVPLNQPDGKRKSEYIDSPPKSTAGYRRIPMMDSVKQAIEEEKEMQKALGVKSNMTVGNYSGFLFVNRNGNVHKEGALNKALKRICNNYNAAEEIEAKRQRREPVMLPHITNHTLRHTFCSRLCEVETNLKVIQTIMGHDDIRTTMEIYAEVSERKNKESFKRLADNFDIFGKRGKDSIS